MQENFTSGAEWSVGEVYGHRAFNMINNLLVSPIQTSYIWNNGVNTSKCFGCGSKRRSNCACGFYAYYNPSDQNVSGSVYGIIKGYGMVDKGSLGFKAEKAEIEAIYLPPDKIPKGVDPNAVTNRTDTSKKIKQPLSAAQNRRRGVFYGALIVCGMALFALNIPAFSVLPLLISVLSLIIGISGYVRALSRLSPARRSSDSIYGEFKGYKWEEFRAHYPDTKVYTDRKKMCKDYADKMKPPKQESSMVDGLKIGSNIYAHIDHQGRVTYTDGSGNAITRPAGFP